ncbi:transposable element Tcb1 transposase [Trichonephila clavipes]|nr:transposable element Tcb1 transposase [Trichonephila clavipes]
MYQPSLDSESLIAPEFEPVIHQRRVCDHDHMATAATSCWTKSNSCNAEATTDLHGRSHPTQCNTSREDRQIVRMAVTNHSVTSRTVAQRVESVTHHSVSARTIRPRLQQSGLSARRPLLGLHLPQNHRRLRRQ